MGIRSGWNDKRNKLKIWLSGKANQFHIHFQRVTDVYSLGATLYEVLTMRPPFEGATEHEIQNAILFKEPPFPRKLNPRVSRDLETVLLVALEKDPDRRYGSAGQFAADLRHLLRLQPPVVRRRSTLSRVLQRLRRQKERVAVAGLAALVVVGLALAWVFWPEKRMVLKDPRQITSDIGLTTEPTVSRDGRIIAYASDRAGEGNLDIWIEEIDGDEVTRLTTDEADDREPCLAPDGEEVIFRSERDGGGLYSVPAAGGTPRRVAPDGHHPRFSPDGMRIAYWVGAPSSSFGGKLYIVSREGGEPRPLLPDMTGRRPLWSPDGKRIMFLGGSDVRVWDEHPDWWITDVNGNHPARTGVLDALRGAGAGTPSPDGWLQRYDAIIFSAGRNIWYVGLSSARGTYTAMPRIITPQTDNGVHPTVSEDGLLVFAKETRTTDIWELPVDANAGEVKDDMRPVTRDLDRETTISTSRDGRKLAYSKFTMAQNIWAIPVPRSGAVSIRDAHPVSSGNQVIESHSLSPDGKWIVFDSDIRGNMVTVALPVPLMFLDAPIPITSWDTSKDPLTWL